MPKSFRVLVAAVIAASVLSALALAQDTDEKKKPKHTIKQVMAKALKGNKLNKKVLSGEATDKEKLELLDMYVSLVENKAPVGDDASWQKFAGQAALAAAKVAVGREEGIAELKVATNCAKCHKAHKPKSKK